MCLSWVVRYLKSSRWNVGVVLVEKSMDGAGLSSLAMKCDSQETQNRSKVVLAALHFCSGYWFVSDF